MRNNCEVCNLESHTGIIWRTMSMMYKVARNLQFVMRYDNANMVRDEAHRK